MSSGIEDRFHFLLTVSLSRGYAIVKDKIAFLKQSLSILHNTVGRKISPPSPAPAFGAQPPVQHDQVKGETQMPCDSGSRNRLR